MNGCVSWARPLKNPSRVIGQRTARDPDATEAIENRSDAGTDGHCDDGRATAAFDCETAMKVLLITRTSKTKKAHDLLEFYRLLPEDCQNRLSTGFAEVANILEKYHQVFRGVRKDGSHHAGIMRVHN